MTVQIHINRNIMASNRKNGRNEAPITIRRGSARYTAHEVELVGPCRIVHRPDNPLSCGARIWIEAEDAIAL